MNKKELAAKVAEKSGLKKDEANRAVDAVFDTITDALVGADKVSLIGFGTFEVSHRKERMGRHPRTKLPMKIAASNIAKFTSGKVLKDAVNPGQPSAEAE